MLDIFASVGVQRFDLTLTDLEGRKTGYRPGMHITELRKSMCSKLIPSCLDTGRNIIVRPYAPPAALLVQLDDLDTANLERVASLAFLSILTSPGNCQVWLALKRGGDDLGPRESGKDADIGRRVKIAARADPSASGATRIAGSVNFKAKYAPDFPTVTILRSAAGRVVTASQLHALGLVAPAPARVSQLRPTLAHPPAWPSYDRCLTGAPIARTGQHHDSFRADFTWCLIAADWGHCVEDIAARLLQVSSKAQKNGDVYAKLTAERAAAAARGRVRAPH